MTAAGGTPVGPNGRRSILFACLFIGIEATSMRAQVYQVDAGTSSLLNATGASLEARRPDSSIVVSAGQLGDAFTASAILKKKIGQTTILNVGDDIVSFDLPSDLLTGSHYVPLR